MSGNFCAEAVGIEYGPNAIRHKRTENRGNIFIGKNDEVRKLPLNKRDATLISSSGRHSGDAAKRRFCLSTTAALADAQKIFTEGVGLVSTSDKALKINGAILPVYVTGFPYKCASRQG